MSFEETLSVGRSKEVRVLEYGDGGMESGLSGSERTEDEVGGKEIIEGEEGGMPSNILEIEGGGDRCYNVEADIVFEVMGYETELAESRKDKGWYYFIPQTSNKEKRNLFSVGPSSINGWKEKFFFVDDTEWVKRDEEVEFLSSWKAKKANQNRYSLNSDEEEEIEKLVKEGGDILDIMYLTSSDVIEAVELYGPSSLSEAGMNKILGAAEGLAIPKKLRKKSKTSENVASEGKVGDKEREQLSSALARAPVVDKPRLELKRKGKLREIGVTTHGKGKALVPPPSLQSSLFDTKNMMAAKNFINAYLPKVDRR
ncbi:hypothetical protein SLEP1_g29460 [Rubroshorea leprosula]|uniref:Uncharacterized protein n=1 Tax=Rubroshorea leprosula TaxID=152421 RepID=A0AAV5JZH5_9ROSI|nr:hypothetical protein SLEP1_g29460 [Rubroshorea leprosula]